MLDRGSVAAFAIAFVPSLYADMCVIAGFNPFPFPLQKNLFSPFEDLRRDTEPESFYATALLRRLLRAQRWQRCALGSGGSRARRTSGARRWLLKREQHSTSI